MRNRRTVAGSLLTAIATMFLLVDSAGKLLKVGPVVEGTAQLGYAESMIRPIGVILLLCVILYVIPRTAILGAVLLTGYMGGAIATHVRVGSPLMTHELFRSTSRRCFGVVSPARRAAANGLASMP